MNVLACVLTGGCAAAAIKAIETIVVWFLNRKAKKEDDKAEKKETDVKKLEEDYTKLAETVEHLKTADRLIMYDRIKYLCRSHLKNGEIGFDDLEDLIEMHGCYHDDLGGNGRLNELMGLVKELPIKSR